MKKSYILLLITIFVFCSCSEETPTENPFINVEPGTISFEHDSGPTQINISSNTDWEIILPANSQWCSFSSLSGTGDDVITLSPAPYKDRIKRGPCQISIRTANGPTAWLSISQKMTNGDPSAPVLKYPENGSTDMPVVFTFLWDESIDPDGDDCMYDLMFSREGNNWETLASGITETRYTLNQSLRSKTTYLWKVVVKDEFAGKSESEVYSFTTLETDRYAHGEYRIYQEATAGAPSPIYLYITGDGYVEEDYMRGGKFDYDAEQATDHFFSIHPYTIYRDHFTVVFIAAYSNESGSTILEQFVWETQPGPQKRDTFFESVMSGGGTTYITCNWEKVWDFVESLDFTSLEDMDKTTAIILLNEDIYAGTCLTAYGAMSIALCPVSSTSMLQLVTHEAAGHGFARLGDEYTTPDTYADPGYIADIEEIRANDPWIFYANVTYNIAESHWNHYIGRQGYESVGHYEGARFEYGAWRPEENSNMRFNIPYYNAPSRESIVRRIMNASGKQFDYDTFFSQDIHNPPAEARSGPPENFIPLAPPIVVGPSGKVISGPRRN